MLANFGWKAVVAILISNGDVFFHVSEEELAGFAGKDTSVARFER